MNKVWPHQTWGKAISFQELHDTPQRRWMYWKVLQQFIDSMEQAIKAMKTMNDGKQRYHHGDPV